ncbi:MAG TPA: NifU family protein [Chthonomonadaceae bacterium]|nr:NifU family protein [Chthonomonadaceae bacterium]
MQVEERNVLAQAAKIETLIAEIEAFPDAGMRAKVAEILQAMLALYGEGLARMLAVVAQQDDAAVGAKTLKAFAEDDLISHLLLLHDLHPVDIETRITRALEEVRPYLQSHGGNVELIGVEEGVARLRLLGHCNGCPSSTMTLKLAIEEAIRKAAPDLVAIEAEGATASPAPAAFVPLASLQRMERK